MTDDASDEGGSVRDVMQALSVHTASRALSKTVMAPFDRVKFLLQCERELMRQGRASSVGFGGMRRCITDVVAHEGWRSLWRGNFVHCAGIMPIAVGQAFIGSPAQEQLQRVLPAYDNASATISYVISTFFGVLLVQCIAYPIDMLRFRLACDTARPAANAPYMYGSSAEFLQRLHGHAPEQGYKAAYRGMGLFLGGSVMYRFTYMSMYAAMLPLTPKPPTAEATPGDVRMAFFAHSLVNWACISIATCWAYPIDTVRRRMMLTVNSQLQYENFLDCASYIGKTEGPMGFVRGMHFALLRGVVTALLTGCVGISFYSQ